jgi:hypothetical protein
MEVLMFKWLNNWMDKKARQVDILWPACKSHTPDLDHAKAAFFFHVVHDPAWTDHYTERELFDYVDKLS